MKRRNYFKECLQSEERTKRETLHKLRKNLEIYERSFDLCFETFNNIAYVTRRKLLPEDKVAILVIIPRIMQSMQAIRLLNLRGYYYDTAILKRSLIEAIGLCAYLALNKEEAERWLSGKGIKEAKIRLFDYVFKLFEVEEGMGEAKALYGRLCDYVHTEVRAIVDFISDFVHNRPSKEIKENQTGWIKIRVLPAFDKTRVAKIEYYPLFVTIMLTLIFKDMLGKKRTEKIQRDIYDLLRNLNRNCEARSNNPR